MQESSDQDACDAMRAIGQRSTAWELFYELFPGWTDQFFAFAASIYKSGIFTRRFMELMSIRGRCLRHAHVRARHRERLRRELRRKRS
jgi:hypothetical protein